MATASRNLRTLRPITPQTNFRLASVTKQFTATAVMLLVHDGKLHYDDRLTDVFPDFPAYGRRVTIRELLTHTSGLVDYEDLWDKKNAGTPADKMPQIKDAQVLELMKQQMSTIFPPRTKWQYSNTGYAMLAMVVEGKSGKPFGQFLHDRIFAPLHMRNTVAYEKGTNEVRDRAYGHTKSEKGWQETDQSPTSAGLGDGGIYTSLIDLAKWDAALRDHSLLTEGEMQPSITPVKFLNGPATYENGPPVDYGFGWFLDPHKGHRRMYHDGETIGFRTTIQRFPDDQLTIVVLCNRADLNAEGLALKVADLYLSPKP